MERFIFGLLGNFLKSINVMAVNCFTKCPTLQFFFKKITHVATSSFFQLHSGEMAGGSDDLFETCRRN